MTRAIISAMALIVAVAPALAESPRCIRVTAHSSRSVRLYVEDAAGIKVAEARVRVTPATGNRLITERRTDANGYLALSLNPGEFRFEVEYPWCSSTIFVEVLSRAREKGIRGQAIVITLPSDGRDCCAGVRYR
jgi:hypothetical protein